MNNPHVLVVEDELDGQELIADMLIQFNVSADVVGLAEEAFELLEQSQYSALIIDLALPGMDGIELLKQVRSNPATAHLRCMAITAFQIHWSSRKPLNPGLMPMSRNPSTNMC